MSFTVTDGAELHALLKTLLAAKFHPDPEVAEVPGSPPVARLCERAVEAVTAWDECHGRVDQAERTRAWFRDARGNTSVLSVVRKRITECARHSVWREWSTEQKAEYVQILLSPYSANEALVQELVEAGNAEQVAAADRPRE